MKDNKTTIDCFIPYTGQAEVSQTLNGLKASRLVKNCYLLSTNEQKAGLPENGLSLHVSSLTASETIRLIAAHATADYTLIYTKHTVLELGLFALERMVRIAEDTSAGMVYADHHKVTGGKRNAAPVIDYQTGSLRDDFDFGSVLLYRTSALKEAVSRMTQTYEYAGLYDLRLKLSQKESLVHINEYLYSECEDDNRKSGEKLFDYVDPKNRNVQIEMEKACTEHLKETGGYLKPEFSPVAFNTEDFAC